ncbi:YdeI/OmpD-associated family protein [Aliifodinibius salicampi]|uniref:YdeI/OmpD-associated family protein n=1 Tax=Fodinibius salicampi TaxID=1920655 RepID=A0ABT3Q2X9_9BACT|nr:YdeI/OmpD-associated family protein [Fodinibius salicampi]MCW9714406.1 YdeI/OmpD-associated family protein [Fodinibius salicampi]
MEDEKLLVNREILLQKFSGKGGWTYAELPEITPPDNTPFGWLTVSGHIDEYVLDHHKLMPMGNGNLFLPVKAVIRKEIGKEAGDYAKIILYRDKSPVDIPDEIMDCFKTEAPEAWENFKKFKETEKKAYLDWIYEAQKEETRIKRIREMLDKVIKNK